MPPVLSLLKKRVKKNIVTDHKPARVMVLTYNHAQVEEYQLEKVEECFELKNKDKETVTWITVRGMQDIEVIEQVAKCFNLHPLLVEDIVNTQQRPKVDHFENFLFLIVRQLSYHGGDTVSSEQISMVVGANFLVTFEEHEDDTFQYLRDSIKKGRYPKKGADHLMYTILDILVDNYFAILERLGEHIEQLEESVVQNPTVQLIQSIYTLKTQMIFLRKSVWPLREVINGLLRTESKIVKKATRFYLRDVYDHTVQVIETMEMYRDMIAGMLEIYLSSISNRLNEVMKVLTIIGTIFIPLTFVTSLYGMNFRFMPELESRYGYFVVLGVMSIMTLMMLWFFRRKKWI
ncbi:MAG: magnesium/cobalt transporter CorA [Nanoarchaeota archaeon]